MEINQVHYFADRIEADNVHNEIFMMSINGIDWNDSQKCGTPYYHDYYIKQKFEESNITPIIDYNDLLDKEDIAAVQKIELPVFLNEKKKQS